VEVGTLIHEPGSPPSRTHRGECPMADSRQEPECRKRQGSPIGRLSGRGRGNFPVHTRRVVGGGRCPGARPGERPVGGRRAPSVGERPTQTSPAGPATDEEPPLLGGSGQQQAARRAPQRRARAPYRAAASTIFFQQRAAACGCQPRVRVGSIGLIA